MTDREAVQFLDDWINRDGPRSVECLRVEDPDEIVAQVAGAMFSRLGGFPTPEDALRFARRSANNAAANGGRKRARRRTGSLPEPEKVPDRGTSEWEQLQEMEELSAKGRAAERFLRDMIAAHPGAPSRVVAAWLDEGLDERRAALRLLADDGNHFPSDGQVYERERYVSRNKSRFFGQHVKPRVIAGLVPIRLLAPLAALVYGTSGKAQAGELVDRLMTKRGFMKHVLNGLLDPTWRFSAQELLTAVCVQAIEKEPDTLLQVGSPFWILSSANQFRELLEVTVDPSGRSNRIFKLAPEYLVNKFSSRTYYECNIVVHYASEVDLSQQ